MKRRDLEKHLRKHDCEFLEHGGKHDMWVNTNTDATSSIPRHTEVKTGTARAICKELGVPLPTKR